jgi:hypothetical protein
VGRGLVAVVGAWAFPICGGRIGGRRSEAAERVERERSDRVAEAQGGGAAPLHDGGEAGVPYWQADEQEFTCSPVVEV